MEPLLPKFRPAYFLLFLASLAAAFTVDAQAKRGKKPRSSAEPIAISFRESLHAGERKFVPDITGEVSCYNPCKKGERGCDADMEGRDEVRFPAYCPGKTPNANAYQKGGEFVIAPSRSLLERLGPGAKVKIAGIPGVGVLCDICPGCDKWGRVLDVASNQSEHREDCPLQSTRFGEEIVREISVVYSPKLVRDPETAALVPRGEQKTANLTQ
jgi:hypothetical protein